MRRDGGHVDAWQGGCDPQQAEAQHRQTGRQHDTRQKDRDDIAQAGSRHFRTALEADRHDQEKRQTLGKGLGKFQV